MFFYAQYRQYSSDLEWQVIITTYIPTNFVSAYRVFWITNILQQNSPCKNCYTFYHSVIHRINRKKSVFTLTKENVWCRKCEIKTSKTYYEDRAKIFWRKNCNKNILSHANKSLIHLRDSMCNISYSERWMSFEWALILIWLSLLV